VQLFVEDIEWIIPGEKWPLAGTHRGQAGLADLLQRASEMEISYPEPPEFVAQGDRVLMVGFARGNIDTQALARASQMHASGLA
jgi:ketosteroid isomerase-like protein